MKCSKCQHELKGREKFCPKCGAPTNIQAEVKATPSSSISKVARKPINPLVKKFAPFAILALISLFFVGRYFMTKINKVDATEYITMNFTGTSGYGSAYSTVDTDTLFLKGFKTSPYGNLPAELQQISFNAENGFTIEIQPSENLKNGDKVEVNITPTALGEPYFKESSKSFEVSGLTEPQIIKAADIDGQIVVNFSGYDGSGKGDIVTGPGGDLSFLSFEVENNGSLSNGDEANIIPTQTALQNLEAYGYLLEDGFKITRSVSGLAFSVNKRSDIGNLSDVQNFLNQSIVRSYSTQDYKTELIETYYRKAPVDSSLQWSFSDGYNNIVNLYQISPTNGDAPFLVLFGIKEAQFDENGNMLFTNVGYYGDRIEAYNIDTTKQLINGLGYTAE